MAVSDLNAAQQKVVLHAQRPALVIAGAGTGKTRVLTERIAYLIQEKKIPADQILALTFTEKATLEMQERIDRLLPLGHADVWVHTFHAFCDRILRERGIEVGIDPGYTLLTQADQWMFLKKHLFAFALNYYRPLGNPTRFLSLLLSHFSRLKDEMITPEQYMAYAEQKCIAARATADLVQIEEAEKMAEVAQAYATYQQLLQKESCLDFGDLLFYTVQLLEKRPSTLAYYQMHFPYIMVDEFQDTNYIQNYLVLLLAKKHRSLMVVGDDDQSIYKWRGASLSNIRTFLAQFPDAQTFVLQDNYRSTTPILDLAHAVIQGNNPNRLEVQQHISKKLIAHGVGADRQNSPLPKVCHFTHYLEETNGVVQTIAQGIAAGRSPSDFAILVRANLHAEPFIKALQAQNISFLVTMQGGLLSQEIIKDFIALLRLISDPSDDRACFRVLALPIFGVPMESLLTFTQNARKKYQSYFDALRLSLSSARAQQELFASDETATLAPVYKTLSLLIEKSRTAPTSVVIRSFLDATNFLTYLEKNEPQSLEHLSLLSKLIQNFESTSTDRRVSDFIDYVTLLEEAGEQPTVSPALDENSVRILTIHSAKGLEFSTVFIVNAVQHRFPAMRRSDPLPIPESLIAESLPQEDLHVEEERRLFYVGCTRAKEELFITYSDAYEGTKQWKPSVFVLEALASGFAEEMPCLPSPEVALTQAPHQSLRTAIITGQKKKPTLPKNLSHSQLETFERCPWQYALRYLYRIPEPQHSSATFGMILHDTLKTFYSAIQSGKKSTLPLLEECYANAWRSEGFLNHAHMSHQKTHGREMLQAFFERQKSDFGQPVALEKSFTLTLAGVRLTGRIDRIDRLPDGTYKVIDYKTGKQKTAAQVKKDLQLSVYALACARALKIPVSQLALYYLENQEELLTSRSQAILEKVAEELEKKIQALRTSDFAPTPGMHCDYCSYRLLCDAV